MQKRSDDFQLQIKNFKNNEIKRRKSSVKKFEWNYEKPPDKPETTGQNQQTTYQQNNNINQSNNFN
jgi:hypothetical protein